MPEQATEQQTGFSYSCQRLSWGSELGKVGRSRFRGSGPELLTQRRSTLSFFSLPGSSAERKQTEVVEKGKWMHFGREIGISWLGGD